MALDHANFDAIGWRIMPDGAVSFIVTSGRKLKKDPATGKVLPNPERAQRVDMTVGPDGTPSFARLDKDSHPRVRIGITREGYGQIEFLDAQGKVVSTLAPERAQPSRALGKHRRALLRPTPDRRWRSAASLGRRLYTGLAARVQA